MRGMCVNELEFPVPVGGTSIFSGTRQALRNLLKTSWIEGVSGSQGLSVLRYLKAGGSVDKIGLRMEQGRELVMNMTKTLEDGGRIDTIRRIAPDGTQISAMRRVFDSRGNLVTEITLK